MNPLLLLANVGGLAFYWHLPLMILVISLVYSATRYDSWKLIGQEAFRWGIRLTGFLLVVAGILYALATFI